jgi:hypothetical protein
MAEELVRVRVGDIEKNMGRSLAEASADVTVLDEPVRNPSGSLRGETRKGGRPVKPKVTVKKAVAKKAASAPPPVESD